MHGQAPSAAWTRAMQTSLILYAEHEFNASTFRRASSPEPVRISTRALQEPSAR